MRLTHLKLAGFKSFVDATTIHLHGQLVGVVGPNGCGKSNVMESVRWVLGESSAKEMRADAMDAVIFNGSSNRNPISRASVELTFDNSLGSAAGEWSRYAEISVKRVIEREKGSTYYINNTVVRRRDVADLFLGTGLGGRAYAIIGQNTISRIVEAKPEELRVFLEEAAGISKYKERRRETELRLRDTRDNLVRVEDICRELQKQIVKLASQAFVTQQYHTLQAAYKLAEGQLWLLKKRDASRDWEKTKAYVEKLVNALESQVAALRKSESELETSRQAHYAASEGINKAQAAYYEANAEVSNLENQVKQVLEARERLTLHLTQLRQSLARSVSIGMAFKEDLAQKQVEFVSASANEHQAQLALNALKQALPQKEALLKAADGAAQKSQKALSDANQRIQIEKSSINYINQNIAENTQRVQRYESDLSRLNLPDLILMQARESELKDAQLDIAVIESALQKLRTDETSLQTEANKLRDALNQVQRVNNAAEAEIQSLLKIQQSLNSTGKVADWLANCGLETSARLWQKIKIDESWSVALEAVLGAKLNALISNKASSDKKDSASRPPGALVVGYRALANSDKIVKNVHFTPLISVIKDCDADLWPILEDWLAGVYSVDIKSVGSGDDIQKHISKLALGEALVNQQGDVYGRHSIAYHGESSSLHGVLERQHHLEQLQKNHPALQQQLQVASAELINVETKLQVARQQQQNENSQLRFTTNALHQSQLELSAMQQTQQVAIERKKNIQADIVATSATLTQLKLDISNKDNNLHVILKQLSALEAAKNADQTDKLQAEQMLSNLRETIQLAEKKLQEAFFNKKILINHINELHNKINVNSDEKIAFLKRQTEAEDSIKLTPMDTLKTNLTTAIDVKQLRESTLAVARNHLAGQEQILQDQERVRLQNEQQLHPMRDGVEQSRLNEQQARLHFEQCQAGLLDNGMNEQTLTKDLADNAKASDVVRKSNQLQQQISDLGAVNLASIQELATETERKTYLDSQMLDLRLATETLEGAIKKIDRETREKLMYTYNTVNGHFNELFATLFGGGQARLELLGDEILDTGLQVFAQPPGKKNTTIQLLSGGEKALTAIALVFALFRLNPAPFCLMDEVDAPLDDSNTERFCNMVKKMSVKTQFLFVSHNKITMEMAQQLVGVTMQESGVSRIVEVDIEAALNMQI